MSWTHYETVVVGLSITAGLAGTAIVTGRKVLHALSPLVELRGAAQALKTLADVAPDVKLVVEDHKGVPDRPGVPGRPGIMPALAALRGDVAAVRSDVLRLDQGAKHQIGQNREQNERLARIEKAIPKGA